ncbi:Tripartite-type tricarboxylate transporter, receptor component TctC [Variovorax sp. YR752]|uniref:Bug family tripartite tricarboxylate transporter substrate binding protein n=1 Tax=unclassified Variovorax TaxID=663243 RepID=UPI000BDCF83E|nr:tripartite tricarboxylate transporter substrate-binding protein [Variovorax sp. YR752]SOE06316.1 Tripartite-type tricarboxylate transporter, receptor component TctC [Variovorax sp. YR752]
MAFIPRFVVMLAATALTGVAAFAQAKPLTIISAHPPGGGGDVVVRLMAPKLSQQLGQPVVIDNKPGAAGNIATGYVVRSQPDGHTILVNNSTLVLNAALGMPQSFNVQKDLKYIAAVASTPIAIAAHPSLPARTVEELVAYARQHPGLSFSSCGNGSPQHFAGVRFIQIAKVEMVHVPYKGCAPAIMDGIGGVVPLMFNTVPNLEPHVKAGKLRYIAIASLQRLAFKPDLPTVAEAKGFSGFDAEVWFGFIGPARLPAPVAKRLEQGILAVVHDKDIEKELSDRYISVRILGSAQYEAQVARDLAAWKRESDTLKIKLD